MIYWYNLHIFGTSKKKKVLGYVVVIFCQERCSESIIQCRNVKELLNKGKTRVVPVIAIATLHVQIEIDNNFSFGFRASTSTVHRKQGSEVYGRP